MKSRPEIQSHLLTVISHFSLSQLTDGLFFIIHELLLLTLVYFTKNKNQPTSALCELRASRSGTSARRPSSLSLL